VGKIESLLSHLIEKEEEGSVIQHSLEYALQGPFSSFFKD
jgi:hypothetical protein